MTTEALAPWLTEMLKDAGESRFAEVDGAKIHYLVRGDNQPNQPVVVLVHGFRGHARWWDAVAPALAARYRVICIDLSGMGDSQHRNTYDQGVFARDIIGVVEHESREPVVVIGHSFGGGRVFEACLLRPDLFTRAIVIDSMFLFDGESGPEDPMRATPRLYPELLPAMQRFHLMPPQPPICPVLQEHLARHSLREVAGGWTWKFDPHMISNQVGDRNFGDRLDQVTLAVDYVYGAHSVLVDEARAQRIVAALPNARGPFAIPHGHHHVMLDQPRALLDTLQTLLAG